VVENGVLRKIFGPARDEVTGDRRKLHSAEFYNLYCSPNVKEGEMGRECSAYGGERNTYRILVGKP
jgi:hypothetical protein